MYIRHVKVLAACGTTPHTQTHLHFYSKFIPVQVKFCSFKKYLVRVKAFWVSQLQIKKSWPCRSQCKSRWAKFETGRAGTRENQHAKRLEVCTFKGNCPRPKQGRRLDQNHAKDPKSVPEKPKTKMYFKWYQEGSEAAQMHGKILWDNPG